MQNKPIAIVFLLCGIGLALAISLSTGTYTIALPALWQALWGEPQEAIHATILFDIRLPRALLAMLVGASLAVAGSAFQAVLRNPLADPYLLGVSGGAAFGAVSALALGTWLTLTVPLFAFVGALLALAIAVMVGGIQRGSAQTLILAGVMVGSLAAALLLFLLWSLPADSVRGAVFWLAGDLSGENSTWLLPGYGVCIAMFGVLWGMAPAMDLLTQGEEEAADLGMNVVMGRLIILGAAGMMTAMAVALAGLVGFVGLVIPHAVRLIWGPSHRFLIPAAACAGAIFLLLADALARSLFSPAELPVGVITAIIGAPSFLFLLRRFGLRR
ncbi:FecCD family ABC transporter permease [Chrysiogenes arsenatis]|uniref:FecCD family ABC transporter permease n=1 Tax=Chrysiogenes arsenatis TaxID=309797 RepID=UPI0003FA3698|nr:iron ABC transporter permease [Chrysiogenes arsenatis]